MSDILIISGFIGTLLGLVAALRGSMPRLGIHSRWAGIALLAAALLILTAGGALHQGSPEARDDDYLAGADEPPTAGDEVALDPEREEPSADDGDPGLALTPGIGSSPGSSTLSEISFHFIDVGQGDSILIDARPGLVVLVDGGPRSAGQVVVDYLVRRGIREIDLMISTHPHADHIGGLIAVLEQLEVHRIIDAGVPHTTRTFDDYISAIESRPHIRFEVPGGQVVPLGEGVILEILGPPEPMGSLNDSSVVSRVDFHEVSLLLTGDAEEAGETNLLERDVRLMAQILKAGHHGSRTSTTQPFLEAVNPRYVVIQCGPDNRYGHPHPETLKKLWEKGASIYRTDLQGTVVFTTDGQEIWTQMEPWIPPPEMRSSW